MSMIASNSLSTAVISSTLMTVLACFHASFPPTVIPTFVRRRIGCPTFAQLKRFILGGKKFLDHSKAFLPGFWR
ncbi:MAG TPA: hypothetical protein VK859_06130 [bacterium]|jgi:hypothetical protein|nr:hypothetical protein [bacterium]